MNKCNEHVCWGLSLFPCPKTRPIADCHASLLFFLPRFCAGSPAIDYFISADAMETPTRTTLSMEDDPYTEQVKRAFRRTTSQHSHGEVHAASMGSWVECSQNEFVLLDTACPNMCRSGHCRQDHTFVYRRYGTPQSLLPLLSGLAWSVIQQLLGLQDLVSR